MKKTIFFALIGILAGSILAAQDIHFSQITETPLWLNPAQAGLGHDIRASVNYKDQWRSVVSQPYQTISASADFALLKKSSGTHLGTGINLFNDKAGDSRMSTTVAQLHVAGIVALNQSHMLSVGVVAGYGMRSMNSTALQWGNQYNGQAYDAGLSSGEPMNAVNFNYFDVGAGMSWMFAVGSSTLSSKDAKIINLGFAVHHLNKPAYSFYGESSNKLPMKIIAHGNASFGMKNTNIILEPSYSVAIQGGHQEYIPGIMCKYVFGQTSMYTGRKNSSALSFGAVFRVKDAFVPMVRYEFSNWAITTSYDINVSGLSAASRARGGFEVSVRFMTIGSGSGGKTLI